MRTLKSCVLCLTLTSLAGTAVAQETVTLRFAPPQGQVTRYLNDMQMWAQNPMMQMADTTLPMMVQRMWMTKTVTAVEGEVRTVQSVTDSVTQEMPAIRAMMEARGMGGMAGAMGGGNQFANMMRGMVLTQRIAPNGKVISTETQAPNMSAQMQETVGKQQGGVGRGGIIFPAGAIRVGDTWSDSQNVVQPQGGPAMGGRRGGRGGGGGEAMNTVWRMTFRLDRIESRGGMRVAVISMTGTISAAGDAQTGMGGSVSGTITGQLETDVGSSRLLSSVVDVNMTMGQMGAARMHMTSALQGS